MRFVGEMIGDEYEAERDIDEAVNRTDLLPQAMDNGAIKIVNRSKAIATAKGLNKTGKGVAGITFERENDDRLIGWSPRPNLHLVFHEIGTYKDYPRPHVRPAADEKENEVLDDINRTVVGE